MVTEHTEHTERAPLASNSGFEIVGPFQGESVAIIGGWSVPLVDVREIDGGTVSIIVDKRLGYSVPAGEAENVLRLVADVIAVAWGYGAHACLEHSEEAAYQNRLLARVPHPALGPRRMLSIGSVSAEEVVPDDDPRNQVDEP